MSDTAVKVEKLWKQYRLGAISHNTLKKDLQSWWAIDTPVKRYSKGVTITDRKGGIHDYGFVPYLRSARR